MEDDKDKLPTFEPEPGTEGDEIEEVKTVSDEPENKEFTAAVRSDGEVLTGETGPPDPGILADTLTEQREGNFPGTSVDTEAYEHGMANIADVAGPTEPIPGANEPPIPPVAETKLEPPDDQADAVDDNTPVKSQGLPYAPAGGPDRDKKFTDTLADNAADTQPHEPDTSDN